MPLPDWIDMHSMGLCRLGVANACQWRGLQRQLVRFRACIRSVTTAGVQCARSCSYSGASAWHGTSSETFPLRGSVGGRVAHDSVCHRSAPHVHCTQQHRAEQPQTCAMLTAFHLLPFHLPNVWTLLSQLDPSIFVTTG